MLAVTSRTRQPWMRNAVFRHNRQVPATIFNDLKLSRWLKIKPSMSMFESIASRVSAAALAAPRRRVSMQSRTRQLVLPLLRVAEYFKVRIPQRGNHRQSRLMQSPSVMFTFTQIAISARRTATGPVETQRGRRRVYSVSQLVSSRSRPRALTTPSPSQRIAR